MQYSNGIYSFKTKSLILGPIHEIASVVPLRVGLMKLLLQFSESICDFETTNIKAATINEIAAVVFSSSFQTLPCKDVFCLYRKAYIFV